MPTVAKQTRVGNVGAKRDQPKGGKSVLDRITDIGFTADDPIQIMLYGRSGTGKTTLWSTFPKPILAIVCSGSMKSGELRSIDTAENRKVVRQVVLENSNEIDELANHVKTTGAFRTVVLDHATGFQDMVLKEILGINELPIQKSWGLATQQQYGQCTMRCKQLMNGLLSCGANAVIVAQERQFGGGDEETRDAIAPVIGAGLSPSLAGWLNSAVDYIGQTFIKQKEVVKEVKVGQGANVKIIQQRVKVPGQVEYCLRTLPDPIYTTKFRVPKGMELKDLVDPTYGSIMELIRGQSEEE